MPAGTDLSPLRHRGEVATEMVALYRDVRSGKISPHDGRDLAIVLRQLAKTVPRTLGDANTLDESAALSAALHSRR